jgi:hypothetical protein
MSGSVTAAWVIPIVAFLALFVWVGVVLHADNHPRYKHQSTLPRTEVAGGAFQALDGGRQLMPIQGHSNAWPDGRLVRPGEIPAQRTAVYEQERAAGASERHEKQATVGGVVEGESRLVPGRKLRLAGRTPDRVAGRGRCGPRCPDIVTVCVGQSPL